MIKRSVLGTALLLALVVLVLSSTHGFCQFISIPAVGETTGKAIEGNPMMVITGTSEDGYAFEYDAIPSIPEPMGIRTDVALLNLAVRPEADATLGVAIGVAGCISYDEWRARAAAEKSYSEKTRGELRRVHLGSIDQPGRWITAVRTGPVEFREQKKGQNGPLTFTAYIGPEDLHPGMNVFIVRVHGIMEQRKESPSLKKLFEKLILSKDGKSIFGTYDEPWLINVGEDKTDNFSATATGPAAGDYVTPQELALALDHLKEEIRAMLAPSTARPTEKADEQGGIRVIWNDQDTSQSPTAETTPAEPTGLGIKFNLSDGATINRQGQVKISFDRVLPAGCWVESAVFANGQWGPWKPELKFRLDELPPGQIALAVVVRNNEGTLASGQLTLNLEDH